MHHVMGITFKCLWDLICRGALLKEIHAAPREAKRNKSEQESHGVGVGQTARLVGVHPHATWRRAGRQRALWSVARQGKGALQLRMAGLTGGEQ
jgi:hypothetical protein